MSIVDSLKRLERIGNSASPTFQKLTTSTTVVARGIADVFSQCGVVSAEFKHLTGVDFKRLSEYWVGGEEGEEQNVCLWIWVRNDYGEGHYLENLCTEEPSRGAVLQFSEDLAYGLLDVLLPHAVTYGERVSTAATVLGDTTRHSAQLAQLQTVIERYTVSREDLTRSTPVLVREIIQQLMRFNVTLQPNDLMYLRSEDGGELQCYRLSRDTQGMEMAPRPKHGRPWGASDLKWVKLHVGAEREALILFADDVHRGLIEAIGRIVELRTVRTAPLLRKW